jgi:HAMP domain-containing protein
VSTAAFGYAAYVRLYATILDGFDRKLAALSSTASVYLDPDEMIALLGQKPAIEKRGGDPELHPVYVKHVLPMRRLREKAGLTFLYTQMLNPGPGSQCVYLVDGTEGEGHSKLGAVDTIPGDDWDVALRVMHDGAVAQTAIRRWDQWGLLKCGWAPMYGRDGQIKAMAGADVEITVIRRKTYLALLETLGVGSLALVLAGLVSVRVAGKLTRPLGEIREASLRIASGDYAFRSHVRGPREVKALALTLNELARIMETTLQEARPRMRAWRQQRAVQSLLATMTGSALRAPDLEIVILPGAHASGYVLRERLAILWAGRDEADELAARKTARDIEEVARRLLARDGPPAFDRLQALFGDRASAFALIDLRDWSVRVRGFEALALGSSRDHATAVGGSTLQVCPGQTVIVAPSREGGAGDALDLFDAFLTAAADQMTGVVATIHRPADDTRERAA